ncbi:Poly(A)-specific ribonuclease PARN [Trichoplax sp. H2]|nr:Poly(A)-specific ribonuclease PARN [Trichoplax sp. H2]|eukprot:RDD43985.1 Poly(A)-specific ribonuclease PARN [Trichoplax sp. H2]
MEVISSNLNEAIDILKSIINKAAFVALDGEFTGINSDESRAFDMFESPAQRYQKISKIVQNFLMIQCGLCVFVPNEDKKSFTAFPFSFYIFPQDDNSGPNKNGFSCQISSIKFLSQHKFNFNKVFNDGMPYLNSIVEAECRMKIEEKMKSMWEKEDEKYNRAKENKYPYQLSFKIADSDQQFVKDMIQLIDEWLSDNSKKILQFPSCSGYHRKIIYELLYARCTDKNMLPETVREESGIYILAKKLDEKEKAQAAEEKFKTQLSKLDDAVGFCKVIDILRKANVPVVGHNMLHDILHLVHQFIAPLPNDYYEFKEIVNTAFPNLYDTKLMATTEPIKTYFADSSLAAAEKRSQKEPFQNVSIEFCKEIDCKDFHEHYHDAGYDAYICGTVFARMLYYYDTLTEDENGCCNLQSEVLQPFNGKIKMHRMLDIPYLNLSGDDVRPSREHVFVMRFKEPWPLSKIADYFSAFGGAKPMPVPMDETSFYIILLNEKESVNVSNKLVGEFQDFTLQKFESDRLEKTSSAAKRKADSIVNSPTGQIPAKKEKSESTVQRFSQNLQNGETI